MTEFTIPPAWAGAVEKVIPGDTIGAVSRRLWFLQHLADFFTALEEQGMARKAGYHQYGQDGHLEAWTSLSGVGIEGVSSQPALIVKLDKPV